MIEDIDTVEKWMEANKKSQALKKWYKKRMGISKRSGWMDVLREYIKRPVCHKHIRLCLFIKAMNENAYLQGYRVGAKYEFKNKRDNKNGRE